MLFRSDKFKSNFLIVLPAAIITIVFFCVITMGSSYKNGSELEYNLWEVLPYIVVLVGALIGINVFLVLISGIVISLIVGVAMGNIALSEMFSVVGDGVTSMLSLIHI